MQYMKYARGASVVLTSLNVSMMREEGEEAIKESWMSPPGRYASGSFPVIQEKEKEKRR